MASLKIPYTRITTNLPSEIYRFKNQPLIKIGLQSKEEVQSTKLVAYIDTGTQACLFSSAYAKTLGIKNYKNTEDTIKLTGIGGGKPENRAYFHQVNLFVFKNQRKPTFKNAYKISTSIGFLEKDIQFAGILGVYGFLDHFSFLANIPEHYFELTPKFEE